MDFRGTQDRTLYLPGKLYTTKHSPSLLLPRVSYKFPGDKHKHHTVIPLAQKLTKADVTLASSPQGTTATHCLPHAHILSNKNLLLHSWRHRRPAVPQTPFPADQYTRNIFPSRLMEGDQEMILYECKML